MFPHSPFLFSSSLQVAEEDVPPVLAQVLAEALRGAGPQGAGAPLPRAAVAFVTSQVRRSHGLRGEAAALVMAQALEYVQVVRKGGDPAVQAGLDALLAVRSRVEGRGKSNGRCALVVRRVGGRGITPMVLPRARGRLG